MDGEMSDRDGYRPSFWGDGNSLELDTEDVCTLYGNTLRQAKNYQII